MAKTRDNYTILWLFWLALFLAIEGAAIKDKRKGDTLSEHIWKWAAIGDKPKGWRWRRITLMGFLAWLVGHFLTKGEV